MSKTKSITKIGLFTALICIGAFISIPLGPVPITLQNFFVFMAGILLTPAEAALAVAVYVILGLAGLPVLAGFTGGIQSVFKPSFGFLIGFIISAAVISIMLKNTDDKKKIFLSLIVAEIITYAVGLPYMYMILKYYIGAAPESLYAVFAMGMIPFIPGDVIKMIIATIIAPKVKKSINK